jgi:transcription antitermination factor NusA-like protein
LYNNEVEIKKTVRIAWKRTKVLVYSEDEQIDPVWIFVWHGWERISTILEFLWWNEKIDFIEYTWEDVKLIKEAFKPAKVQQVEINWSKARVIVEEWQKALAIWRKAVNVTLVSKLTWYNIEIV